MIIAENLIRSAGGLRQSSSVRANRLVVPSVPRHPKRLHLSLPSSGPNRHVCNVSAVLSGGSKVTSAHRGPKSSVAKAPSTRQKPEPKALYLGLGGAAALLGSFAFIASQLGPEAAHHVAQYTDAHGPTTLYDLLGACGQPSNSLHSVHATSSAAGHVFTPHHSTAVGAIPSHSNLRSGLAALQASVVPFSPDFISASCPYVSSPAAPAALSNIVHHAAQPVVSAAAASSTSSVQHFTSAVSAVGRTAASVYDWYSAWLEESPLVCKIITGNIFTVLGDLLAQFSPGSGAQADSHGGNTEASKSGYDAGRTLRLCLETSLFGTPLAHYWFQILDSHVYPDDPHSVMAVLLKNLLDQALLAPFGLAMFFVVLKCLEGQPKDIAHTLRTKYLPGLKGMYMLWPAANVINFAFVAPEYRVLYANVVNIAWTYFLSKTQAQSPPEESPASTPASLSTTPSDSWLDNTCLGMTHGALTHMPLPIPVPCTVPLGATPMQASSVQLCSGYEVSSLSAASSSSSSSSSSMGGAPSAVSPPATSPLASTVNATAPACASSTPALELCQQLPGQP